MPLKTITSLFRQSFQPEGWTRFLLLNLGQVSQAISLNKSTFYLVARR